ncbi:MAG: GatB/YqeY domain-containing protein [Propionibacteriaceae bacterium]|jgi:uncharacterized protein YqeY|nr:GatB/YqeY domain-containing protein [Propionibacteriaceae bacterium]
MAELKDTLRRDLTAAMRQQDKFAMQALRMALAALAAEEVAGAVVRSLAQAEEEAVLRRELRKRREAAEIYATAGRPELAAQETAEADLLERYLPAALSDAELDAVVEAEVAALPGATVKQMGVIVKAVNARVQGRAEGKTIAAKVKAALGAVR